MTVRVLGTLDLDGVPISPRERAFLAALALRPGTTVMPEELADAVWGERPPGTWAKQVQIAIGRLRRHPGVPPIVTTPDGYRLDAGDGGIDAAEFERLVAEGRTRLGGGQPDRAEAALVAALGLWRGMAYADLADWPPAAAESQRLDELREFAQEELLTSRLALGRTSELVGDAELLVRTSPLRERRWELLAIALYRSDRQADALAAIREARRRFADELGVELSDRLADLERAILRHDPALDAPTGAPSADGECPYRGLDAFDADDEATFFGRDREIAAALDRLSAATFVAFTGPSGCGKSSLIRAGLVPALRRAGRRVEIVLPRRGAATTLPDLIGRLAAGDVLVIDQFEEFLHLGLRADDLDAVGSAIAGFAAAGGTVVAAVRSDHLDDCAALPHLAALFVGGVQLVPPMGAEQLREAVEGPAAAAALRIEAGLTELILRDAAGRPGVLPLVSHALVETWLRRDGATLTVAGYEDAGGLSGAIAQSADLMYRRMTPEEREVCRSTMLRLVALGSDGTPVRRSLPTRVLHEDGTRERVLELLSDARLVSADESLVVVAHEALADAWPRLHRWLEEDMAGLRTMHAVSNAAEAWDAGGRLEEDLLRGARLQGALEWAGGGDRSLTATEKEFLAESARHEESDRRALEERAKVDRRQNRRLRSLLAAASALIVALVGVGTFAGFSANEADRQRGDAAIEALVGTALSLRDSERDVAALLAAEAYRRWPDDPRTRAGLMGVVSGVGGFLSSAFIDDALGAYGAVIPGTRTALVATDDGSTAVRSIDDAAIERELDLGFEPVFNAPPALVAVSGDGRIGAVLWPERVNPEVGMTWFGTATSSLLSVFDLGDGERVFGPERVGVGPGALAVDRSGTTIAVAASSNGSVRLIDVASGTERRVPGERTTPPEGDEGFWTTAALAFGPDGRLYAGRLDGRIDAIDPVGPALAGTFTAPVGTVHFSIAVDADDLLLASGERGLVAIDPRDGSVRWHAEAPSTISGSCTWIAASKPMGTVYCSGQFGHIDEYSLVDGRPLGRLEAKLGTVGPLATIDGGLELVAISMTGAAILRWRLDGGGPVNRLVATGFYIDGGYSGNGSLLLARPRVGEAANDEGTPPAVVVDVATGELVHRFDEGLDDPTWGSGLNVVGRVPGAGYLALDAITGRTVAALPKDTFRVWPSPRRDRIYAAQEDWSIVTVDGADGEVVGRTLAAPDGFPVWVAGSPDSSLVGIVGATGGGAAGSRLGVFDAETGAQLNRDEALYFATIADDGSIVGFDEDRITRIDSVDDTTPQSLAGTAGGLGIGALSADGRTLLVTAADQSAQVFDLPSGERVAGPFTADPANLTGAFLRPDGHELAVTVADGIMLWDLDPEHQLDAVCRIAGRNLTVDEWRTYLPGFAGPERTCE